MKFAFSPTPPPISATDFRRALAMKGDITPYLPETSQNETSAREITDLLGATAETEKKILSLEHLYSLVDNGLFEGQEQQVDEVFGKIKDWFKQRKKEGETTERLEVLHDSLQANKYLDLADDDKEILANIFQSLPKPYSIHLKSGRANEVEAIKLMDIIAKDGQDVWNRFFKPRVGFYVDHQDTIEKLRHVKQRSLGWEEVLEEISAMGVGSVEGVAGPHNKKRKRKPETLIREDDIIPEEEENMQVDREQFIEEQKLRKLIRKGIGVINERRKKSKQALLKEEQKLRSIIRDLVTEGGAATGDASPHKYTGINVLEKLLKKIIPVLETDYKQLTSSEEQRQSFRSHIVSAVENTLAPVQVNDRAPGGAPELPAEPMMEQDDIDVTVDTPPGFIDVGLDSDKEAEPEQSPEDTEKEDFGIEGANVTGRNAAFETFKQVENQIVDSYGMLADEEDKEMFYDYLITNLKLYFDKFEEDLAGSLEEPTTDEYEAEVGGTEEPVEELV